MQLIKEVFLPAFDELNNCILMTGRMLKEIKVNKNILDDDKYAYLFSVEEVNEMVLSGVPFRDAYRKVGMEIEEGKFKPNKTVHHTHEGSIGNLCNDRIEAMKQQVIKQFDFSVVENAENSLLESASN
jgi:argininosuccinate lyase